MYYCLQAAGAALLVCLWWSQREPLCLILAPNQNRGIQLVQGQGYSNILVEIPSYTDQPKQLLLLLLLSLH